MDLLQVASISKKDERGFHLENISFKQSQLTNIAIAGETGSGKTTLLKIIAGLAQPDKGAVYFKGEKVIGPADKLIPGHKGIVYLSQTFDIPHFLRVEQVLEYANEWSHEKAAQLFRLCRITHLLKRRTDQLSGGERQRIAIARLLVMDPQLFLLDEPFSNMDQSNKNLLKQIIEDLGNELGISFLMVSHDPVDTLSWAAGILVLQDGKLIEQGSPQSLYDQPQHEYTAGLFGKYNYMPATEAHDNRFTGKLAIVRPEHCHIVSSASTIIEAVQVQRRMSDIDAKVDDTLVDNTGNVTERILDTPVDVNDRTADNVDKVRDTMYNATANLTDKKGDTDTSIVIPGKVSSVRFYGHYYEVEVTTKDGRVLISRSKEVIFERGDEVKLVVPKSAIRRVIPSTILQVDA